MTTLQTLTGVIVEVGGTQPPIVSIDVSEHELIEIRVLDWPVTEEQARQLGSMLYKRVSVTVAIALLEAQELPRVPCGAVATQGLVCELSAGHQVAHTSGTAKWL